MIASRSKAFLNNKEKVAMHNGDILTLPFTIEAHDAPTPLASLEIDNFSH
jgi:hypothetical protein